MERPTFVDIDKRDGDNDRLRVEYSTYGSGTEWVNFVKEYVDEYVALIDKYLKWEEVASSKGDMLDKKIGDADLWWGASVTFRFYSGNTKNHYLVISVTDPLYFDKKNALILRKLLIKFKNNQIHKTDESDYN